MPSVKYYRAQAEVAARLAAAAKDPQIADGYNRMALEQLAKADAADPGAAPPKTLPDPAKDVALTPRDQTIWSSRRAGGGRSS